MQIRDRKWYYLCEMREKNRKLIRDIKLQLARAEHEREVLQDIYDGIVEKDAELNPR